MKRLELNELVSVRTEGGLLPAELLQRIAAGDPDLPGLRNVDYHLEAHERPRAVVNDAWNSLEGSWLSFQEALKALPEGDPAVKLTRDRWLLPLFHRLDYGRRLPKAPSYRIDERSYPISHHHEHVPIHLLGWGVSLDQRTSGVAGAAHRSPHGLVQELLNRSDAHLWAMVSNGRQLRLLRDHHSLSRQAFVEFDLQSIFEGDQFSEFLLLWLVCHESRTQSAEPSDCWLEKWFLQARQDGVRALDRLRDGVQRAIEHLGAGFLAVPSNTALREALGSGALDPQDYYRELLRLVYRLIFLFVAEDREVDGREALLDPRADLAAVERYRDFYGTRRLRRLARRRLPGGGHVDLWRMLRLVMEKLGDGYAPLALPGLDSFLFSSRTLPHLEAADLSNRALLDAVWAMDHITEGGVHRRVNWRHIGSEELGSVYEALLELIPVMEIDAEPPTFHLGTTSGHERKTTGSYYTPSSLVDCLLDSALDPVLEARARQVDAEAAILAMKVCDPACGSGHFLVAAARRMAAKLAAVRAGEDEPSPTEVQRALRDVVGRCIYGIDINPMAVELCKVSLWMEALEPGRPLSFLDHHIQVGNSLLGTTPTLMKEGIPDEAFVPIEGDDPAYCRDLKKENKKQRTGQMRLFSLHGEPMPELQGELVLTMLELARMDDTSVEDIRKKEARYAEIVASTGYRFGHLMADTWCAAFVWPKVDDGKSWPITHETFERIRHKSWDMPRAQVQAIRELAADYQFLHPHLAFPEVFRVPSAGEEPDNPVTGLSGGFDVVLGNPPWDRVKLQEKEWFSTRSPDIASAKNAAARRRKIKALETDDPPLAESWRAAKRRSEGTSALIRRTGRFPLCGRGDVNTYSVFAELMRNLLAGRGRIGCIIPSGIATDDTTKYFFQDLVESESLASFFDFQTGPGLWSHIGHARFKFALVTMTGTGIPVQRAEFAFFLRDIRLLDDPENRFELTLSDIELLNPNTKTCPIFRSRRDAEITKGVYSRVPVLWQELPERNSWGISFKAMLHMSNDSGLFRTIDDLASEGWHLKGNVFERDDQRFLPLYEAKMVHHFDHRFGDYRDRQEGSRSSALPEVPSERLEDPSYSILPRYWVAENAVDEKLGSTHSWLLGWRDIARSSDFRTTIAGAIPRTAVNDKFLLMLPPEGRGYLLQGILTSFAFDFAARQKLGGTSLKYFTMRQLPVLAPDRFDESTPWYPEAEISTWLRPRVLELTYTAWDLEGFARDCGYEGQPFRWDEDRRFLLRCELDAAFFHLYGIERDDVDYIMGTFPIVEKRDIKAFGEYRTKVEILDIYDKLQAAIDTGEPYQTVLDPPPADPSVAHPPRDEDS